MSAARVHAADLSPFASDARYCLVVHITRIASALFISLIETADTALLLLSQVAQALHARLATPGESRGDPRAIDPGRAKASNKRGACDGAKTLKHVDSGDR
jgi:hypothetical protein